MNDYILLMHNDAISKPTSEMWTSYFAFLGSRGVFDGGSSIGAGEPFRKESLPGKASDHLAGYIRVRATSLNEARELLTGNPVYECGGTVEVRDLPRD
jgi:hypothetical protein